MMKRSFHIFILPFVAGGILLGTISPVIAADTYVAEYNAAKVLRISTHETWMDSRTVLTDIAKAIKVASDELAVAVAAAPIGTKAQVYADGYASISILKDNYTKAQADVIVVAGVARDAREAVSVIMRNRVVAVSVSVPVKADAAEYTAAMALRSTTHTAWLTSRKAVLDAIQTIREVNSQLKADIVAAPLKEKAQVYSDGLAAKAIYKAAFMTAQADAALADKVAGDARAAVVVILNARATAAQEKAEAARAALALITP